MGFWVSLRKSSLFAAAFIRSTFRWLRFDDLRTFSSMYVSSTPDFRMRSPGGLRTSLVPCSRQRSPASVRKDSSHELGCRVGGFAFGTSQFLLARRADPARRAHACLRASGTDLLVDADTHSLHEIEAALSILLSDGQKVSTTVFAEPSRCTSQRWRTFLQEHSLKFHAVKPVGGYSDPTDQAIKRELRKLAAKPSVRKIALMVSDTDFLENVQLAMNSGSEVVVLMPSEYQGSIHQYESAGATVLRLERKDQLVYKVKAVLHADGSGSVRRCLPFVPRSLAEETPVLESF